MTTGGTRSPVARRRRAKAASALLKLGGAAAKFLTSRPEVAIHLACLLVIFALASCVAPDTQHQIVISAHDQKLALLEQGKLTAVYPVSTSKFGLGDWRGSFRTPLGELEVADKIGDGAPLGTRFKDGPLTGEIVAVDAPGRDPIVTRIIWLRGREPQNANAFARDIYIHGTPEERNVGRPASYGCIRMRSTDIINLYDMVGLGAHVTIVDLPLDALVPELRPKPAVVIR